MNFHQDIQYEIMTQGPVQAVMEVHTDFFMYGEGVYHKTNMAASAPAGYHAVRIVGWGEEFVNGRNNPYWVIVKRLLKLSLDEPRIPNCRKRPSNLRFDGLWSKMASKSLYWKDFD